MKISAFLLAFSIVLFSCAKPSYKKNDILITDTEIASESSIFDPPPENQKLSADHQIA